MNSKYTLTVVVEEDNPDFNEESLKNYIEEQRRHQSYPHYQHPEKPPEANRTREREVAKVSLTEEQYQGFVQQVFSPTWKIV